MLPLTLYQNEYITRKTSDSIECHLISTYLPTLENTMRSPDETRIFCEQLSSLINSIKQRDALIIRGECMNNVIGDGD